MVAAVDKHRAIIIYDADSLACLHSTRIAGGQHVLALSWARSGQNVIILAAESSTTKPDNCQLSLVQATTGRVLHARRLGIDCVHDGGLSPCGRFAILITSEQGESIGSCVRDTITACLLMQLRNCGECAWHPQGNAVVFLDCNNALCGMGFPEGVLLFRIDQPAPCLLEHRFCACWAPGKQLVALESQESLYEADKCMSALVHTDTSMLELIEPRLPGAYDSLRIHSFSPDGHFLLASQFGERDRKDGCVLVLEVGSKQVMYRQDMSRDACEADNYDMFGEAWSPDGRWLAVFARGCLEVHLVNTMSWAGTLVGIADFEHCETYAVWGLWGVLWMPDMNGILVGTGPFASVPVHHYRGPAIRCSTQVMMLRFGGASSESDSSDVNSLA